MEIRKTSPTQNFEAKLVCKTVIERKIPFTPFYRKAEANFVKLERGQDILALTQYASTHPEAALTSECVFDLRIDPHTNAFAITTQKNNLHTLDSEQILGICDGQFLHRDRKPVFYIQNLETQSSNNPQAKHKHKTIDFFGLKLGYTEKYQNIGRKMLRELTRVLNHSDAESIELKPVPIQRRAFYERLGFTQSKYNKDIFEIQRQNFVEFIARN